MSCLFFLPFHEIQLFDCGALPPQRPFPTRKGGGRGEGGEEDKSFSVVIKKSSVSGVDFSLSRMMGSVVATVGTYLHREP